MKLFTPLNALLIIFPFLFFKLYNFIFHLTGEAAESSVLIVNTGYISSIIDDNIGFMLK